MADIKIIVDSGDVVTAAKRVDKLGNSVSSTGKQSQVASNKIDSANRGMNQFGVVAQNGGKKLNTFNMQLQQGGYQLQDFVVQLQGGTSFFTAFGQQGSQFAGVFGPQGAVVGAIIAIGSAVGGMAYSMIAGANSTSTMEEALTQLNDALKETKDLVALTGENFDDLKSKFGPVTGEVLSLAQAMQNIGMRELSASAEELTSQLLSLYNGSGWTNTSRAEEMATAFELGQKATDSLVAAVRTLQNAGNLDDQVAAAIALRENFEGAVGPVGQMTAHQYKYYTYLIDAEAALRETQKRAQELSEAIEDGATEQERMTAWAEAALGKYGRMRTVAGQLATKLSDAADEAERLAGVQLEQMAFEFSEGGQALMKYGARGAQTPEQRALEKVNAPKKTKTKTGGGASAKDPLQTLQEQIALQQALLGKTEAQQQIINALGVDYQSKYKPSVIDALETQITLTGILSDAETKRKEALEQARQQQEQLADFIANSMGDALMSVVDGTMSVKDAFKSMAADIIKELYRVLVVQQLVNSAKGFLGFADSGAFSGGSQVQAYANGGVVGGPTTFPMAGGKTGLMGEAGPEAIMPLKRGANGLSLIHI